MSAVVQPNLAPVDYSRYIPVQDAAPRLDKSIGHLARLCSRRGGLASQGLAVMMPPLGGGLPRWHILRAWDGALALGEAGEAHQIPAEFYRVTQEQQDDAWRRATCVTTFREWLASHDGEVSTWIGRLVEDLRGRYTELRISRSTVYGWAKVYRSPADIIHLVDRRGGDRRGPRAAGDPAAWDLYRQLYLDARGPTRITCWKAVCDEAVRRGWQWISYHSLLRQHEQRISRQAEAKARAPEIYRSQFAPYIQQRADAWPAGACWVGDHATLDFWCMFGKHRIRPTITAWLDWRSRRITGWTLCAIPSSTTILAALRSGILADENMGGPGAIWIDNGKDYDCWALHGQSKKERLRRLHLPCNEESTGGILGGLGIESHFSLAYNPNGKARMERWFLTLHDQFDRTMPTYCGKDPQRKPEGLNELLRGKPQLIPAWDHVQARLADYIAGFNGSADRAIDDLDGLSADAYFAEHCPVRRKLADPASLDRLLEQWHKPVRVGRNGVTIAAWGHPASYGQFAPELARFKGDKDQLVRVAYDPKDITKVRVYTLDFKLIVEAPMNHVGGDHAPISSDRFKEVVREQTRYDRAEKTVAGASISERLSMPEKLAKMAREEVADATAQAQPGSFKLIQTPLDGQSAALEEHRLRKAAGAEFDAAPRQRSLPRLDQLSHLVAPDAEGPPAGSLMDGLARQSPAPGSGQPTPTAEDASIWERVEVGGDA